MPAPAPNVPASHLPAAARKVVKEANRLIAELNARPGEVPAAAPAAAAGEAPDLPTIEVTTPPADATAAPAAAAAAAPTEAEDFKAKYLALRGKYNKEIAEVNGRLSEQQQMINRVLTEQATLRAVAAPTTPAAQPTPEDRARALGVTDKEIADYGVELVDLVERVSSSATTAEIRALRAEIDKLKGTVGHTSAAVAQDAQQKVFDALFRDIGQQWVAINNSDEFLAWLQDIDVFSGTSRHQGLQHAFQNHDAARVVAIFKAYVDGGKTPAGSTSRAPAVNRETLIAPGSARGSTGEAPGSTSGKIWSEQEIRDFYQRARKGKIPAAEYTATEAEINRAMIENRIRVDRSSQHHTNNG